MAEADKTTAAQQPELSEEQRLKYLEFVHAAAARALVLAAAVYIFAKDNSGPLKSGVETVEGAVKNVVGPVYVKFHDVPIEILKFADQKVVGLVDEVKRHVPPRVKEASTQAVSAAQKVPEVARTISSEVQRTGVVGTATCVAKNAYSKVEPAAKELYVKYEPVAEQYAVKAWRSLNRLPLVPEVAQVVVPTAAHWTEKYNKAVVSAADQGYAVSNYLPLVPIEKIAKVFGEDGKGAETVEIAG